MRPVHLLSSGLAGEADALISSTFQGKEGADGEPRDTGLLGWRGSHDRGQSKLDGGGFAPFCPMQVLKVPTQGRSCTC